MKTLKKYKKHLQTRKKYAIIYKHEINRGVAQLVARVVWDHEVAGSIPVTSTRRKNWADDSQVLFLFLVIIYKEKQNNEDFRIYFK